MKLVDAVQYAGDTSVVVEMSLLNDDKALVATRMSSDSN